MAILHLVVGRKAIINPFHLILLSLGKLRPIYHARGPVKTWSCWVSRTTVWFELNLYCFLKRRNVSGLVVQVIVRPLALVFQKSLPSLGSSHPHCSVAPCVCSPYLHNCLLIAPIIFLHSTCLKPNSLFTTSHPTTLNTHTYVNLKPKQRASFSPIFVFGTTFLQLKLDNFFFHIWVISILLPPVPSAPQAIVFLTHLVSSFCILMWAGTFLTGVPSSPISSLTFLLYTLDVATHLTTHFAIGNKPSRAPGVPRTQPRVVGLGP